MQNISTWNITSKPPKIYDTKVITAPVPPLMPIKIHFIFFSFHSKFPIVCEFTYSQAYSKEYNFVSGTNNIDSIIASGDINISSKIIDINGLIQSGSEIKSVTIPDFKVIKEGDKYYQVSGNSKEEMVKNATDEYYCISLIGNGQGDSDLETIKAYFKISNESPVGSALIGKKVGDVVEVVVPNGVSKFEILSIRRD